MNYEVIKMDGVDLLSLETYFLNKEQEYINEFIVHHELEISMVKSGSGEYLIDGKVYEMREGDIFVLNNIEFHQIINIDPRFEFINEVIMFDPRFVWSLESNLFDARFLAIFFERKPSFKNRIERDSPTTRKIRGLFMEMSEEFQHKLPGYELLLKVKLLNILALLTRHYGLTKNDEEGFSKRKQDLALLNKVIHYIDLNLTEPIRLEDLAAIVYMNPSYFSTFFKKHFGINPSEYLARKRIRRAIEYLRNSDKTILEISTLCGFNNTANFNKTFKKMVGRVPSEVRKLKQLED
ncbi:MAG: AraC family transcriptional regulator [Bacillota bacterium]